MYLGGGAAGARADGAIDPVSCGGGWVVSGFPHLAQNLAHSAFSVPHLGQDVEVDN